MKRTDTVAQLGPQDRLPRDRYILRCLTATFGMSQNQNPMITVDWEIVSDASGSDTVQVGDRSFNIAGKKVRKWYLTRNMADVFDLFDACGCTKDEIDENNPPVQELVGKTVDAILYTKESPKFKEPTLEQRAQGAKVGDPILGADGQPIKFCEIVIDRVLGPVTV